MKLSGEITGSSVAATCTPEWRLAAAEGGADPSLSRQCFPCAASIEPGSLEQEIRDLFSSTQDSRKVFLHSDAGHADAAGRAATLYYILGYQLREAGAEMGKTSVEVECLLKTVRAALPRIFGLPREDVVQALKAIRVAELTRPWVAWCENYERWIQGEAEAPPALAFNFAQRPRESMERLFDALRLPWRPIGRHVPAGKLVPSKCMGVPVVEVYDTCEVLRHRFMVADAGGRKLSLTKDFSNMMYGAWGSLTRLVLGEGPADLMLAFQPRRVSAWKSGDDPWAKKRIDLLSECWGAGQNGIHIPAAYPFRKIVPFINPAQIVSGRATKSIGLFTPGGKDGQSPDFSRPVAIVYVDEINRDMVKLTMGAYLGELARWSQHGAKIKSSVGAAAWLDGRSNEIPRLEPMEVRCHRAGPGKFRKFVLFGGYKFELPHDYAQGRVCVELYASAVEGERRIGLWSPHDVDRGTAPLVSYRRVGGRWQVVPHD